MSLVTFAVLLCAMEDLVIILDSFVLHKSVLLKLFCVTDLGRV